MSLADQLTLARAAAVPLVIVLFAWDFDNHNWWATGVFIAAMSTDWLDGRVARWRGRVSALGSLLDPVADKLLVLTVLIMLLDQGVFPGWMVAAIVARELLVSGLRLAALERGVVMHARDLGKLKTWSQATAAAIGGFAAAGAWDDTVAWWALLVALVLTWLSGLGLRAARAGTAPRPAGLAVGRLLGLIRALANPKLAPAAAIRGWKAVAPKLCLERTQDGGTLRAVRLRTDLGFHRGAA
jgi:CDP-diacylglycerol--glycerol-3-phosphate 3-phosphatidyltransferase